MREQDIMAAALPVKVRSFLKDIEDINSPTEEQRQRALELLAETMRYRNAKLCRSRDELVETARKLKELHLQLQDMNRRLELAKKTGMLSKSVH
jgi:hypothetical protein